MNITKLSLHNWRNFREVAEIILPKDALLVAAAPNATGKTNFLESVLFLLRGKSFRASAEECLAWGEDDFTIRGDVETKEGESLLTASYNKNKKKLRIEEGKNPVSPVLFYARYPLVTFLPDDTFIFARGPAQRRNFLNHVLVCSSSYVSALVQYQRALKQRNASVKGAQSFEETQGWTDILSTHADALWRHRRGLTDYLAANINAVYKDISGDEKDFKISLDTSAKTKEDLKDVLKRDFKYESRYGYTLHGPHRDDLRVELDNKTVMASLSQGQTRSLVVALKIVALRYIEKLTNEQPLLLLDEVLSELDQTRQDALLENLPSAQTLLVCTAVPEAAKKRDNAHLLDIGSLVKEIKGGDEEEIIEKENEGVSESE